MTDWRTISPAVHYTATATAGLDDTDLTALEALVPATPLGRARICTHRDPAALLQEMMIVLHRSSYVRPHCHPGKAESLHVLKGRARLLLFDAQGRVDRVVPLAPFGEGATWYFRIADPVFHTLLIETEHFAFHETTTGPFDPADTVFAPWAPEADAPECEEYLNACWVQSQP